MDFCNFSHFFMPEFFLIEKMTFFLLPTDLSCTFTSRVKRHTLVIFTEHLQRRFRVVALSVLFEFQRRHAVKQLSQMTSHLKKNT